MKVTWLGQAGLMFESGGKLIIADPYLSDSVEAIEPHNKRRVAVDESFLSLNPDIILLTHNHLDHTDPDTLKHYLKDDSKVTVLAPKNAWQNIRNRFNSISNNFVLFDSGTRWTEGEFRFEAVKASHSDETAIGIIMEAEGHKYYITGDTLYNKAILASLPDDLDYVFLPVNGRGNNMNMTDAKDFCEYIGAKAVPMHCGLFDDFDMNAFEYENKVVPQFYKEIIL